MAAFPFLSSDPTHSASTMIVGNVWLTDFAPTRAVTVSRALGERILLAATKLLETSLSQGFVETVESLCLNGNENCIGNLEGLPFFVRLKSLWLENSGIRNRDLKHLIQLKNLEELLLTCNLDITDAGVSKLESLSNLKYLSLEWTGVTDAAFKSIAKLTKLEELAIGGPWLTGSRLAELQALPGLKKLTLIGDRIDNACLEHLRGLTGLTDLDLGLSNITDAGLEHIMSLTGLKTMQLPATISEDAARKLAQSLPHCKIR